MWRSFALFSTVMLCWSVGTSSANAQSQEPQEVIVYSGRLDHVENPDIITQWRTVLDTEEARAVGNAVTSYYGCVGCYSMVGNAINQAFPRSSDSEEHKGVIQAPIGYTVCRAYLKEPTSVTCNGTLTGSYRTADDPQSAHLDGLHWYMVVPHPAGIGPGRCWVDAGIVVEFLHATPGNRERRNCGVSGTVAFHIGK